MSELSVKNLSLLYTMWNGQLLQTRIQGGPKAEPATLTPGFEAPELNSFVPCFIFLYFFFVLLHSSYDLFNMLLFFIIKIQKFSSLKVFTWHTISQLIQIESRSLSLVLVSYIENKCSMLNIHTEWKF